MNVLAPLHSALKLKGQAHSSNAHAMYLFSPFSVLLTMHHDVIFIIFFHLPPCTLTSLCTNSLRYRGILSLVFVVYGLVVLRSIDKIDRAVDVR